MSNMTTTTTGLVFQEGDRLVCADGVARTARGMAPLIPGEPAHVVVEDGTQWIAANCHRASQGHLTAICVKTQAGHRLRVLSEADTRDLVRLDLDWDTFRPMSAGDRLLEQGYMIRPAQELQTTNGWREIPGQDHAWSASVVPIRTPAQIDAYLRTILTTGAYLGFQQAIGERVLDEAVQDANMVRASADNDGLYNADWYEGWDDALQRIDPDHNDPAPVELIEFPKDDPPAYASRPLPPRDATCARPGCGHTGADHHHRGTACWANPPRTQDQFGTWGPIAVCQCPGFQPADH